MLTRRRRQFTAGTHHFTFSNPIHRAEDDLYGTWAERIKDKYSYFGKSDDHKIGAWTRRIHREDDGNEGQEEFRWLGKVEEGDDSDVQSPTLWKEAGSPTTRSAGASPIRDHSYYPSSRAQTIARHRQEMLDMVRDMPETAYELSLRDIVEQPRMAKPVQETQGKGREVDLKDKLEGGKEEKNKKGKNVKKKISRSVSMDAGGFLLKMFVPRVPTPFGSWRSRSENSATCAKLPPKIADGEWWNKEEFGEKISSNSSSNSSSNRNRRKMSGCYSFFHTPRWESRGI